MRIRFLIAFAMTMLLADFSSAVAADPASTLPAIRIPYEEFTLDNGLRVVVHEDRSVPVVAVHVWYRVGSADEPVGRSGFAHLFEHLMFSGSENYNSNFDTPFDDVGVTNMNATTSFDRTNYFETVPTPALEMALWMESDRMGHLLGAITQQELDLQRSVVQNEKREGENSPYGLVGARVLEGLFPIGHPYRHDTIGSMEDLNAASLEDVRTWFREYYGAANAVVVLAGDIDTATARPLMQRYFGHIAPGPPLRRHRTWVPTLGSNATEEMADRMASQTRIYRSWAVAPRASDDAAMLEVAATILGNGIDSRLYQALVYRNQLAVAVNVTMQPMDLASRFQIQVTLRPGADEALASRMIDETMERYLSEGPTEDEVARARMELLSNRLRAIEQISGVGRALYLAQGALHVGNPAFFEQSSAWIRNASTAGVRSAASAWLSRPYHQLLVRPFPQYQTTAPQVDRSRGLPTVGEMPPLRFPVAEEATLSNGMKVVLANRPGVGLVNVSVQFDAGRAADAGRPNGTARFATDLMPEGTSRRSALQISAELDRRGAQISSENELDTTTFSLSSLRTELRGSMDVFADMIRNPTFPPDEIERIRRVRLAGIVREQSVPVLIALRLFPALVYGAGHPYGVPQTGTGSDAGVRALAREDLIRFHRDWIRPDNATIYLVGDVTMAEALPELERAFGSWRASGTPIPAKSIAEVAIPDRARVVIVDVPGAQQSLIFAGHLFPPTSDQNYLAHEMANDIVGGQFSSRLNMNLREQRGWAYGAQVHTEDARGQRLWFANVPVQVDRTRDSIAEILREMREYIGTNPATAQELDGLTRNRINKLPGQFETGASIIRSLVSSGSFGRPYDYVQRLPERYRALTLDQVQDAARQVIHPNNMTWLIVGDRARIEAGIRALNLGDIEIRDRQGNRVN